MKNPHLQGGPFLWSGGPDGVLLIHGYTATTAEVRPLAGYLQARGYSVAGPLLPGHGTEPADANRYRWLDWVHLIEEAYRDLASRCARVIVGGESTGALLALYLTSLHPEIKAVLAYAPALQLTLTPLQAAMLYVVAPFVPVMRLDATAPTRKSSIDDLWQGYPVKPLRGVVELLRLQRAVKGRLRQINQPLLLVQGRQDRTVAASAPQIIYDGVRSDLKELHWVEQAAHCVILDNEWQDVAALTAAFIERVLHPRVQG